MARGLEGRENILEAAEGAELAWSGGGRGRQWDGGDGSRGSRLQNVMTGWGQMVGKMHQGSLLAFWFGKTGKQCVFGGTDP